MKRQSSSINEGMIPQSRSKLSAEEACEIVAG